MNETTALLEPATLAGMGIRRQPFEPPAENELYSDEALDIQVRMLRHNLQYSDMLQVLYGEPGAGKTCLAIRLVDVVNHELEMFVVRGEPGLTSSRIVADLLRALDLEPGESAAADLAALAAALNDTREVDAPTALVIDDAHVLDINELKKLLHSVDQINEATRFGFRLLLMAEPSLEPRLQTIDSPLLLDGRLYTAHLKPLSIEQTEAYLAHRLAMTGASWPFSDDEVVTIAENAHGLPGDINQVAAQSLNYRHSPPVVDLPLPVTETQARSYRPAILVAVPILVLAAIWLIWPATDAPQENDTRVESLPLPAAETAAPTPVLFKDETDSEDSVTEQVQPPVVPLGEPAQPTMPARVAGTDPVAPESSDNNAAAVNTEASPPTQQKTQRPASSTSTVAKVAAPRKAPPRQTANDSTRVAITERSETWLRRQATGHYVVQLMAASDVEIVEQFVRRHGLRRKGVLFITERNGSPWHVLVYGLYPDADSARKAIPALPAPLRRHSPWIRSIASIQAALDDA